MEAGEDDKPSGATPGSRPTLKRGLTLPLLALYGLGVTIGAGIYVLVGETAARAGIYAPVSFLLAAAVVAFTGFSYAELGTRYPVSAGEAAYVGEGLRSRSLSLVVGLMVVASGLVSSAAISIGAAAYLGHLVPLPEGALTALVILLLGLAAAWGIVESVALAALFTLIEIGGLGLVIHQGLATRPELLGELGNLVPPLETEVWTGIGSAGLLAFFAFIGFEDMANVAEEVKQPRRTLPRAILLTLVVVTVLYIAVVSVVVLAVPVDELTASAAPLALIFEADSPAGLVFTVVASIATVNGVLVQMIMALRVLYGLASRGNLPKVLAAVSPMTRTPLVATALVVIVIFLLAFFLPIAELAETTSKIVLTVFIFVNAALLRLKWSEAAPPDEAFLVPIWVPALGLVASVLLLLADTL